MIKHLKLTSIIPIFSLGLFINPAFSLPINSSLEIAQQTPNIGREIRSFFETGRLTSEDRLSFQNPPSGVIPIRNQSNSWQFILFKEGRVSFWMPPGILTEETILLETSLGDISFRTLASHSENQDYIAAYAQGLTDEQIKNTDILLQGIENKITPNNKFRLTSKKGISLEQNLGKELTFESEDEIITFRIYFVGNRLYALGVRYPKSMSDTRSIRAFLNALDLLDS
ncbi:MAG: hypothetical protein AB4062_19120 [Crocosphaera sp.]